MSYLPLIQSGLEIFSRYKGDRRAEKNAKRMEEARAGQTLNNARNQMNNFQTLSAQGTEGVQRIFSDPMGMENQLADQLKTRLLEASVAPIPAAQPGRSFSQAMASYGASRGSRARDAAVRDAADVSRTMAPSLADSQRALLTSRLSSDLGQEQKRMELTSLDDTVATNAAIANGYRPAGTGERLSQYVDAGITGARNLARIFSRPKAKKG